MGLIFLGTLATVLTLSTPTVAKVVVFAGGFFGTLLVGAMIPRVRSEVLGIFFQTAAVQSEKVVIAKRKSVPDYFVTQTTPGKTLRPDRNTPESSYKYTRLATRKQAKRLEKK